MTPRREDWIVLTGLAVSVAVGTVAGHVLWAWMEARWWLAGLP